MGSRDGEGCWGHGHGQLCVCVCVCVCVWGVTLCTHIFNKVSIWAQCYGDEGVRVRSGWALWEVGGLLYLVSRFQCTSHSVLRTQVLNWCSNVVIRTEGGSNTTQLRLDCHIEEEEEEREEEEDDDTTIKESRSRTCWRFSFLNGTIPCWYLNLQEVP